MDVTKAALIHHFEAAKFTDRARKRIPEAIKIPSVNMDVFAGLDTSGADHTMGPDGK